MPLIVDDIQVVAAVLLVVFVLFIAIRLIFSSNRQKLARRPALMFHGCAQRGLYELQAVLDRLSTITRLNLPLGEALRATAMNEHPRVARSLDTIADKVDNGESLTAALRAACPRCPSSWLTTFARAESCGQIAEALGDQARTGARVLEDETSTIHHVRHAFIYAAIMIFVITLQVQFLIYFIAPKYRAIFYDFGVTPSWLHELICLMGSYWWIGGGLLLFLGLAILANVDELRGEGGLGYQLVGRLRSVIPIARDIEYGFGMARALRSMKYGLRTNDPAVFGPSLPAVVGRGTTAERRLKKFVNKVAEGTRPHEAARQAMLGNVVSGALKMIEHGTDPDLALEHAAEYHENLANRWWLALTSITAPLVTLAFGVIVCAVVLAFFLPLVALINSTQGILG